MERDPAAPGASPAAAEAERLIGILDRLVAEHATEPRGRPAREPGRAADRPQPGQEKGVEDAPSLGIEDGTVAQAEEDVRAPGDVDGQPGADGPASQGGDTPVGPADRHRGAGRDAERSGNVPADGTGLASASQDGRQPDRRNLGRRHQVQ